MVLLATRLTAVGYRSYEDYTLDLGERVTVLVGPNAAGKTNLIEAIQLLTSGQSFRRPAPAELVRERAAACCIELALAGDGRCMDMAMDVTGSKRTFWKNGKRVSAAGVRGVLPSVLFCPDDLDMVKRSAGVRRGALDVFGCQLSASYADLVASYGRIVEQRNSLLRDVARPDAALIAAWDESLVAAGAALTHHRAALLARIRARFVEVMDRIAPTEAVDVTYMPNILDETADASGCSRDELAAAMGAALASRRDDEMRRRQTLVGPHRDEVLFTIDGRPARAFGSQGQQRSVVLAWKIAEVEVTRDILGTSPILLLDDVMSELDESRREAVVRFIGEGIQTVITTTNLGYFTPELLDAAKVVHIGDA